MVFEKCAEFLVCIVLPSSFNIVLDANLVTLFLVFAFGLLLKIQADFMLKAYDLKEENDLTI
ncbi:hypothetical protein NBRC110019_31190 [Neptunitalea chrysea]|uniref:DUF2975 domain-containing protein n=2 Tax=Neptunitalea chrysea TaxID=1647581 RepID=A0A9W6B7K3_9FLAO|nr:hypothetical protein NBRC110019_31190 [Neptunitalea chrysea]